MFKINRKICVDKSGRKVLISTLEKRENIFKRICQQRNIPYHRSEFNNKRKMMGLPLYRWK